MPILFISLSETFIEKIQTRGFTSKCMKIQEYIPNPRRKKTYYVSPANSLCFMDGGIDYALSRIIFPGIEKEVKEVVKEIGLTTFMERYYLPIGSSIIIERTPQKSLVVSPTMLLPQDVSATKNAYYATMATLYNILKNKGEDIEEVDILLTSFCCGYGNMDEDECIQQMIDGINNYMYYKPIISSENIVINEPNINEQPKYYQNTEFFEIAPQDIEHC